MTRYRVGRINPKCHDRPARAGRTGAASRCCLAALAVLLVVWVAGCLKPTARQHYFENSPLAAGDEIQYYKDYATSIAHPVLACEEPAGPAYLTEEPRRLRHPQRDELLDLTLSDAIHMALSNSEIIRDGGQFLSPGNTLLRNPELVNSVYDVAIQETGVLFGRRGEEAALADFDAQFITNMTWSRSEQVQNNAFLSGGLAPGDTLVEEAAALQTQLAKPLADGGLVSVSHNWNYSLSNVPARLFGSSYTGLVRAEYRRPLWAASGVEFTRINGPIGQSLTGVSGVSQGVVIARINNDISVADFELAIAGLLKDVEDAYWDLALAYRTYDAEVASLKSSLRIWRAARAKLETGGEIAGNEALARDAYYENKSRKENALADLYALEARLRRLLGLPVNDGYVIRPIDEPAAAEFVPDWGICLAEAVTRRTELRRQKWSIKSLELQLQAARSLVNPRLDVVGGAQVNAFGDDLFGEDDDDGVSSQGLDSAYETLTQGDQTGWDVALQFSMPIGFRAAHTQVRNVELRLAKARAALAAQEREVSYELANAFQQLDRFYATAQTNLNRREAARERFEATVVRYESGIQSQDPATLDLMLRAQISLVQSESTYFRALIEYNKAVADIHLRKGTLLELNGVELAENQWHPQAYIDALRRAWERTNALPAPHLKTEPLEFAADPWAIAPVESLSPLPLSPPEHTIPPAAGEPPPLELVPPAPPAPIEGEPAPMVDTEPGPRFCHTQPVTVPVEDE